DRIVVAGAQAPVAVSEHARHGRHTREAGPFLRARAQHPTAPFGVLGPNAGGDVLRHGSAGSLRVSGGPAGSAADATGDEPQDDLSPLRAAHRAFELNYVRRFRDHQLGAAIVYVAYDGPSQTEIGGVHGSAESNAGRCG